MLSGPASALLGTWLGYPNFLVSVVSRDYVNATAAQKVLAANNQLLPSHPGFLPVLHLYFAPIQDKTGSAPLDSRRVTRISRSSTSLQDIQTDNTIQFHWSYGVVNEWPLSTLQLATAKLRSRIMTRLSWTLFGAGLLVFHVPLLLLLWKESQLNKNTTSESRETA